MWIDVPCPDCEGRGWKPGLILAGQDQVDPGDQAPPPVLEHGHDRAGDLGDEALSADVFIGSFPCERCNGEGKEAKWLQDCEMCGTTGMVDIGYGEGLCPKCRGRGGYERGPRLKSRYTPVKGSWTTSNDVY